MKAEKILFITQDINPYVPESDLTFQGHDVPLAALDENREARAFMPKWGNINERRNQLHEVIRLSGLNIIVDDVDHQLVIKVASLTGTRMQVYFIDNDEFFGKRLAECNDKGVEYKDNYERAAFYARGVLETVKKLRWVPEVIHCQGWMSSLVPAYIKTAYADEPSFRNCKVITSINNERLTKPSNNHMGSIIEYRTANEKCIAEFGKSITPTQLTMLAAKYSDGIIVATEELNPDVEAYLKKIKKPVITVTDNQPQAYLDFFDKLWVESQAKKDED